MTALTAEPAAGRSYRSRHPLMVFLARRILIGLLLLVVMSFLVFLAMNLLPGDAARAMLGAKATPEQISTVHRQLGLDRPLLIRYGDFLGNLLHGNLGTSLTGSADPLAGSTGKIAQTRVSSIIAEPARNTLVLGVLAVVILIPLSLVLGVLAGIRPGRLLDRLISNVTLVGLAIPDFIAGMLLILLFAVKLGWLPPASLLAPGADPLAHPDMLVLPVATLVIVSVGFTTRQVRAGLARAMNSDYVDMARLNGIPEGRVVRQWGLRNAIAPAIQSFAQIIGYLLGGVVLVEYVFSYPGIGYGFVQYVNARDLPTVQAVAVIVAAIYVGLNIVADLLVILVVPRLRTEQ
jgi:peptide/nickel transport system permease protein